MMVSKPIAKMSMLRAGLWVAGSRVSRIVTGWITVLLTFCCINCDSVRAGLTGTEVIVVVNGASQDSRTLANYFVSLRDIPAVNVIVLGDIPAAETIAVDEFRQLILTPLIEQLRQRKLTRHFQCIAYSADFPTAIDISGDLQKLAERPKYMTPKGSLNGLTYLYQNVLRSSPYYADLNSNFYARRKLDTYFTNPAGNLTAEEWKKIQELIEAGAHSAASVELEELHQKHRHQFPLLYLSGAEAAAAGESERAIKLLQAAVNGGWDAGGYMALDERLDSLRDNSEYQVLELLVDKNVIEFQPGIAFDARVNWTPNGIPLRGPDANKLGLRYLLSVVLGVTRGAGTTLSQAVEMLQRSADADFSHPDGCFYFCATKDVRSRTRQWSFLDAVDSLKAMGFQAEIVPDKLPQNKPAVLGAQVGTPNFNWAASGSTFVPGAIADNLTSFGGIMSRNASQTKLTEFIRAGAAGSSGTVTEPLSIHQKFPLPQMYVQYARGASLAEAFYMAVAGPYQLLIVGDPLCRPFSHAPVQDLDTEEIKYLNVGTTLSLNIDLSGMTYEEWSSLGSERALRTDPFAPATISVLIDGLPLADGRAQRARSNLNLRTRGLVDGYHEVTLKLTSADPLAQKCESILPLWIGDRNAISLVWPGASRPSNSTSSSRQASSSKSPQIVPEGTEEIRLRVTAPGADRVSLWHDWEQLATAAGEESEFSVAKKLLGSGPVRLHARGELEAGKTIQSAPLWLQLQ